MDALFVHGLGRSPLSAWPMLRELRRGGLRTTTFGYVAAIEDFASIQRRLAARTAEVAGRGDYIVIGHSLGGVLLRAALASLPAATPQPLHAFLLGSPVRPSRLARDFARSPLFRAFTRDCGELLASPARMAAIGPVDVPVTGIAGVRRGVWKAGPFAGEPNDGIVSLSEVSADWLDEQVHVPTIHAWLPSSGRVAAIILERVKRL